MTTTTDDILIVFRALRAAATQITEEEEDGYGACRYCHAESMPVDADGKPIDEETEEADHYSISHEEWCPSAILDRAYAGLDEALVDRVLAAARDA